ncbi:GNAT family N-acetyltransferase [Amycolatopsis sp. NPDC023774]|uniref:GNAT family N-acetyltransferase n=1 Tax=Amycolatopsis sp. NPDC023774 TaxID=3155015 RepID=UPI0033E880F5
MSVTTPPVKVLLSDGEVAWVRRLDAGDVVAVLALHAHLSGRDRCFWSFGLGTARLDRLATQLARDSGIGHTAAGCFVHNQLVGVARYQILPDPAQAEIALVVDNRTRTHGIATLLLEQLVVSAGHEGVRSFVVDVLAQDSRMFDVFAALGLPCHIGRGWPERQVTLSLAPAAEHP